MLALYRKYRPHRFEDVIGQDHIIDVLKNAILARRIAHAYLFSGPRGVGKTTVARLLARAVNCTTFAADSGEGRVAVNLTDVSTKLVAERPQPPVNFPDIPCNECENCKALQIGFTLDIIEIDAASTGGVDEVRSLREAVQLMPLRASYKTYIIDEVHMLSRAAFNALLKTLEEPPLHAIFVLATTEPEKVPDTVISRTQHFRFRRVGEPLIIQSLQTIAKAEGISIDQEAVSLLAVFADGSLRDGQSMLDQVLNASKKHAEGAVVRALFGAPPAEVIEQFLGALLRRQTEEALTSVTQVADSGTEMRLFLKLSLRDLRAILLLHLAPKLAESSLAAYGKKEASFLRELKTQTSLEDAERFYAGLLEAYDMLHTFALPHAAVELVIAKLLK